MFTTCPNCALNLAVTAADLRIGQGYVRCGRCVSVFNALISLADESEVSPGEARVEDTAAATQSRPIPGGVQDAAAPASRSPPPPPPSPAPAAAPATAPEDPPATTVELTDDSKHMSTGTFETIVLEGDTILQTEEFVDEAEVDEQLKALAEQLEDQEMAHVAREEAQDDALLLLEAATPRRAPSFAGTEAAQTAAAESPQEPVQEPASTESWLPQKRARRPLPRWLLAAAGLLLLLVLQAVHHWRAPLARHVPALGRLYAGLGAPLEPEWLLAAYDVRQLGAAADPTDARRIEVRASVRNGADHPQPAPLLRVVLQDRFGNELARHELAPAEYLRGAPLTMLAADQRVDASLTLQDPEQKAVGFELDACLPAADGALRCASDAPAPRR
jgi:predicted Zn finger-like uncharacterized protein